MKRQLLKKSRLLFLLGLFLAGCNLLVQAQVPTVKGRVTDLDSGEGLPGVSVLLKGTATGTTTDAEGNYTLPLSGGTTIVFSYIGYRSVELDAGNGQTTLDVKLESDIQSLQEVVVVGYGTQKKSDVTGAISSAKGEELRKFASNAPADAIQGKVAGVMIRRNSGGASSTPDITIRGFRSLGNNFPLVIIDGIQGNINNVNPEDIQSIEVLKDAAAASIYGSTAANGVLLITTKKAKTGSSRIDFTSYVGVDQAINKLQFMNTSQYLKTATDIAASDGRPAPEFASPSESVANTNWYDEIFSGNGAFRNYNLSISGASDNFSYLISGGATDRNGILQTDSRDRKNARVKLGMKKGIFSADANISYQLTKDNYFTGSLSNGYETPPIIPVYDATKKDGYGYRKGTWVSAPDPINPIAVNNFTKSNARSDYITTNIQGILEPIKGLKITGRVGIEQNFGYAYTNQKPFRAQFKDSVRFHSVSESHAKNRVSVYESFVSYTKQMGDHSIDGMIGGALQNDYAEFTSASVEGKTVVGGNEVPAGFLNYSFNTISAGTGGTFNANGSNSEANRISYFGRVNYNYKSKYFLQASIRRDASSRFGPATRYGYFPSIAVGWTLTEEDFFKVSWINSLKLRGSYGILGSESNLGTYTWQVNTFSRAGSFPGTYPLGIPEVQRQNTTIVNLENIYLKWEEAVTYNVGLDFGLFENKLTGNINYYNRSTNDLIINPTAPLSTGAFSVPSNLGDVLNRGIELEANYNGNVGQISYTIGATYSYNYNEVTKTNTPKYELLGSETIPNRDNGPANRTRLGNPVGAFFVYQADGLFQSAADVLNSPHQATAVPGDLKYKDVNGDGQLNNDDLVYAGSGIPKNLIGLNLGLDFKGIDASVVLYAATDFVNYNAVRQAYTTLNAFGNQLASAANYWTPTNTNTDIPRVDLNVVNVNYRNSTRYIEKGDYLRVRNIQLGYTMPKSVASKLGVTKLRFYVSGQNLFTVTSYTGLDPEIGNTANAGTDFLRIPSVKTYLGGIELSF